MPRLARSSARCGPTPLIMRTSVVRERGIYASFIPSAQRWHENRNDAPNAVMTHGMLIGSICEIGAAPLLLVNHNMPTPPRIFGCVAGKGVTGAFRGCVAAKRLSAIDGESTEGRPRVGG